MLFPHPQCPLALWLLPSCRRPKAPHAAPGLLWLLPAQPLQHGCPAVLPQLMPCHDSWLPFCSSLYGDLELHISCTRKANAKKCLFPCSATSPVCSPSPLPMLGTDPACSTVFPTRQFLGVPLSHAIPYPTDAIHIHRHGSLPHMATPGHSLVPKFWCTCSRDD